MRNPRLRDTDGTEYDPETGVVVTPLSGRPRCVKFPDRECHGDCEFGLAGFVCVLESDDA